MKVLICDDEQYYSHAIQAAVERWIKMHPESLITIDVYNSSEDMLESLRNKTIYDLAFLDIQFPGEMNGLEVARKLRFLNEQMVIVFISNYEEYAIDGYRVNAFRFFYKPITDEQVFECIDLAYHQWQLMTDPCLLLESKQQMIKLAYKSIYYIESRAHYLEVHLINQSNKSVMIRQKISDILQALPAEMFVQCHRSYIVNLLYVQKISRSIVTLSNYLEIPISTKYHECLLEKFRAFFQGIRR